MRACFTSTKPQAGVIATSPTTPPVHVLITLDLPLRAQDISIQVKAAEAAAVFVVTKAFAATPLAERTVPALKQTSRTIVERCSRLCRLGYEGS